MGVGVFVTVKVPDDKKEEFLKVMEVDVVESRKEEGCISFDLCDQGDGVYSFYEVYKDAEAAAHHKTLPHYMGWAECVARDPLPYAPPIQPSDQRLVRCVAGSRRPTWRRSAPRRRWSSSTRSSTDGVPVACAPSVPRVRIPP